MNKKLTALLAVLFSLLTNVLVPVWAATTDITVFKPANINGSIAADSLDATFTAADVSNGNSYVATGKEMVIVLNSHASSAYTFTVTSVADDLGRTGDITTYSLAAGEYAVVGPVPVRGWRQPSSGKVLIAGSNAAIKFLVIRIPDTY